MNGAGIIDPPQGISGLDVGAACVAAKSIHLRDNEYPERVPIDIVGPMSVRSAGGKEYAVMWIGGTLNIYIACR